MTLFFGARSPEELPYFGPLKKVPDRFLRKIFAYSRREGHDKKYVQDEMRAHANEIANLLHAEATHIYVCGLKDMENGVNEVLTDIASDTGLVWADLRDQMRSEGRFHVETY